MKAQDLEDLEIDLLLEALDRRYGYDFRRYARASLRRRLKQFIERERLRSIADLVPAALREPGFLDRLVNGISVSVTEPFREPVCLAAVRQHVFPWLQSHAYCKIWHAGCSSGEEVYSLAILLDEAGMLDRVQVYGTDINTDALAVARAAIYPLEAMRRAEENYERAGGQRKLSDYYVAQYGRAKLSARLARNLVFSQHNLATDAAFGEMQFILCRNVLIYFNRELQARVFKLFSGSLARRGFLALGAKESMGTEDAKQRFETIDSAARLFRAL
ncbi:MAG TPA: protein-glutamate O-methyltransferase CheR [Verrucomicrobiae bacterium]|nr:protein-glutamate O-methyltransferase CheR [Verrucomicrobiae bacterium]